MQEDNNTSVTWLLKRKLDPKESLGKENISYFSNDTRPSSHHQLRASTVIEEEKKQSLGLWKELTLSRIIRFRWEKREEFSQKETNTTLEILKIRGAPNKRNNIENEKIKRIQGGDITSLWMLKLLRESVWPVQLPEGDGRISIRVSPLRGEEERDNIKHIMRKLNSSSKGVEKQAWLSYGHVASSQPSIKKAPFYLSGPRGQIVAVEIKHKLSILSSQWDKRTSKQLPRGHYIKEILFYVEAQLSR